MKYESSILIRIYKANASPTFPPLHGFSLAINNHSPSTPHHSPLAMNDPVALAVVDDVDGKCGCSSYDPVHDSVYHSFLDDSGRPQLPNHRHAASMPLPFAGFAEVDPLDIKDQRTHERATQRLKKPHDRARAKMCTGCRWCCPGKYGGNAGRPKQFGCSEPVIAKRTEEMVGLEDSVEAMQHGSLRAKHEGFSPVSLADFIKSPKKGSDKRFELIGRPRQVLVLDDFTEIDPGKNDADDWEVIIPEVKQPKVNRASYARVVANNV